MNEKGVFTIRVECIIMRGMATITTDKLISTVHHVTAAEAQMMADEHHKQAKQSAYSATQLYSYHYQPYARAIQPRQQ